VSLSVLTIRSPYNPEILIDVLESSPAGVFVDDLYSIV